MVHIQVNRKLCCDTFVVMQHVIMTDGVTVSDQVGLGLTTTEENSFIQDHTGWIVRKLHHSGYTNCHCHVHGISNDRLLTKIFQQLTEFVLFKM